VFQPVVYTSILRSGNTLMWLGEVLLVLIVQPDLLYENLESFFSFQNMHELSKIV
jgi:hypothetical protein